MTTPTQMTPRELAAHMGFKPNYGNQLLKDGRLVLAPDGKHVLVQESIARVHATKDPSKQGVADRHAAGRAVDVHSASTEERTTKQTEPVFDYQSSKAKASHYEAEKAEVEFRKIARTLTPREEMVAAFLEAGTTMRSRLEVLATILPPLLAHRDEAQIQAAIADEVEQILNDVKGIFERHAERAANG